MEGISPLPWFGGADEDGDCIYAEEDGKAVLVAQTMREDGYAEKETANARLILMACNTHAEMLAELEPIANLYHEWIADESGRGHPLVSQYASSKPRAERFSGISLTRDHVLRIVGLVAKAKGGA